MVQATVDVMVPALVVDAGSDVDDGRLGEDELDRGDTRLVVVEGNGVAVG